MRSCRRACEQVHVPACAADHGCPPALTLARHDPLCPRYLIEKANVALVPGDAFGAPTCIRISYAASMETLAKALDRLEAALAPANFTRSA